MNYQRKELPSGIPVLELVGSITMGRDCELLQSEVEHVLQLKRPGVVFDLTAVTHIDSAGVGKLVSCYSKLKKAGIPLRLAGARGVVESALKLTHVDKIIGLYPTAEEAAGSIPPTGSAAAN
jgi:anti-anti-sigma factor